MVDNAALDKAQSFGRRHDGSPGLVEDVLLSLEKLNVNTASELSAEEEIQNEQDQEDEISALEAIYAEDFCFLDRPSGASRAFTVNVQVELSGPIQAMAKLPDAAVDSSSSPGPPAPQAPLRIESSAAKCNESMEASNVGAGPSPSSPPPPAPPEIPSSSKPESSVPCAADSTEPSTSYAPNPGSGRDSVHRFTVDHLPPIQLLCILPASYPSHAPPMFQVSAFWLNKHHLSKLCTGLDSLWPEGGGAASEGGGQVVVYSFVDWLSRQTLSYLGMEHELELGPYGDTGRVQSSGSDPDPRAVSESRSLEDDVPRLMRLNEERKMENFRRELHSCFICFNEHPGSDFLRLNCGHFFCWDCMRTFSEGHVADGSITSLICPDTTCRGALPPGVLREVLSPESFERWEALTLQRTLDTMADLVYCPRCREPCLEDSTNLAQCTSCFFAFCSLCSEGWHPGRECMTAEARLRIMQERGKGKTAGDEQARREQDLMNEVHNLLYVKKEARSCPNCKMAISKSEGCNKMTCTNCGQYFCYRCSKAVDGYDHYWNGNCILFEDEEVQRWEEENNRGPPMADAGLFAQAAIGMWPERRRVCPLCRQENYKDGNNNHMACWACRNHFCGLCGQVVRSSAEHFGPSKCKQHSR